MHYSSALAIVGRYKQPVSTGYIRGRELDPGCSLSSSNCIGKGWWSSFSIATHFTVRAFRQNIPGIGQGVTPPVDAVDFGIGKGARFDLLERNWRFQGA